LHLCMLHPLFIQLNFTVVHNTLPRRLLIVVPWAMEVDCY
jgi:hypothetical protein